MSSDRLCSDERRILAILDEDGGFITKDVVRRAGFWMSSNSRSNSAQFRARLARMKERGLVDYLDDQTPACWRRTPAGSKALALAEAAHV